MEWKLGIKKALAFYEANSIRKGFERKSPAKSLIRRQSHSSRSQIEGVLIDDGQPYPKQDPAARASSSPKPCGTNDLQRASLVKSIREQVATADVAKPYLFEK